LIFITCSAGALQTIRIVPLAAIAQLVKTAPKMVEVVPSAIHLGALKNR